MLKSGKPSSRGADSEVGERVLAGGMEGGIGTAQPINAKKTAARAEIK